MANGTQEAVGKAREEFLTLVADLRPELHRYAARLTGSVIDGEDIVQETLARAFYTLSLSPEMPPLRPWLFKIGHNAAVDFLKSHGRKTTEPRADLTDVAGFEERADPFIVRAALARFLALATDPSAAPSSSRTCSIIRSRRPPTPWEPPSWPVKAALVLRGAASSGTHPRAPLLTEASERANLDRYSSLFNARDWDGGPGADRRRLPELDLVSRSTAPGQRKSGCTSRTTPRRTFSFRLVRLLEGGIALAAHLPGIERPAYFVLLEWTDGRVRNIRDYRYVPYVAAEAQVQEI